jgi:hypothetical protein
MTPEEEILFESVLGSHRSRRSNGEIAWSAEWFDLSERLRIEAAETTIVQRELERAMDPQGLSSTIHAVMSRISKT